jgi:peptidoglycan/LPS O-acetylase OafA/YrhL
MRVKYPNLDLIRTIAIALVILSHLPINFPYYYHKQTLGLLGVEIFFVHTSLVLMLSLKNNLLDKKLKNIILKFYIQRLFRIFPLSVLIVTVLILINYYLNNHNYNYSIIISNILLIQNITKTISLPEPLWSLPYELQFYIFLPFIFFFIKKKNIQFNGILMIWISIIILIFILYFFNQNYHYIKFWPCFFSGIISYVLWNNKKNISFNYLLFYLLFVIIIYPILTTLGLKQTIAAWPICLCLGIIIANCKPITNEIIKKFSRILAKYSYSVYLIHQPIIDFSVKKILFFENIYISIIIAFIFTALISFILYNLIEKKFVNIGKKIIKKF